MNDYGLQLISEEREKQLSKLGWTSQDDDTHTDQELLEAAVCYSEITLEGKYAHKGKPSEWPWDESWWKPGEPIRNLAKAGALIAAEISRLHRLELEQARQDMVAEGGPAPIEKHGEPYPLVETAHSEKLIRPSTYY